MNNHKPSPNQCLEIMVNDPAAVHLFEKGPLSWFKLQMTIIRISVKGTITEKQQQLIFKVFDEYTVLKKVHYKFKQNGYIERIVTSIYQFLQKLPPSEDRTERGRRGYLGQIKNNLSAGQTFNLKFLESIEEIAGRINPVIAIELWEEIQQIRLQYLQIYYSMK
jgi:hypothetical protein